MPLHKEQSAPSAHVEVGTDFAVGAAATLIMPLRQQTALTAGWADCMIVLAVQPLAHGARHAAGTSVERFRPASEPSISQRSPPVYI